MLTPKVARALTVIRDKQPLSPKQFAHGYFPPDHPGWKRNTRSGHGTSTGGGLVLFAGGFLGKLRKQKLINGPGYSRLDGHAYPTSPMTLSTAGQKALLEYEACHGPCGPDEKSSSV